MVRNLTPEQRKAILSQCPTDDTRRLALETFRAYDRIQEIEGRFGSVNSSFRPLRFLRLTRWNFDRSIAANDFACKFQSLMEQIAIHAAIEKRKANHRPIEDPEII